MAYRQLVGSRFRGAVALLALLGALVPLQASSQPQQTTTTPLVKVSSNELLLREPVTTLAVDGKRAGFVFCHDLVGTWRPGASGIVGVGPPAADWACPITGNPWSPFAGRFGFGLAIAGRRVAWADVGGGINQVYYLHLVDTSRPGPITWLASGVHMAGAREPDPSRLLDVLGKGDLLVFSTRVRCGDRNASGNGCERLGLLNQSAWRALEPSSKSGSCPGEVAGPCKRLTSSTELFDLVSVDSERIAVREADGTIEVRDAQWKLVRSFKQFIGLNPAVELMGDKLIVFLPAAIYEYSLSGGQDRDFVASLPRLPFDGVCLKELCTPVSLRLLDAAHGLVLYRLAGKLHLHNLETSADKVVAKGADARFGTDGLFYTYQGASPWPGRIRFLPWSALPLKPSP